MIEGIPPAAYELGDPLAEYKTKRFNTLGGPIMAAVGLLFLVLGCQFSQSLVLLGILGMILLPFGLFITLFGLKQRGLRVILFRDGFMYQQPKATQIVRWQDIAFVHKTVTRNSINLIYMGKTFTYTIQTKTPSRIILDDKLERIEHLGDTIQEQAFKHAQPLPGSTLPE